MASPLEALPSEILDSILEHLINHAIGSLRVCDHLDCTAIARLSQCSLFLNHRLEKLLYATSDARNAALANGCMTGNLHAIRKAVSCGAKIGVVRRHRIKQRIAVYSDREMFQREVSSLHIALKSRQLEAFNLLLHLGAGITPHDYSNAKIAGSQLEAFTSRLAEQCNVEFLTAFVEARATTLYRRDGRKNNCSQAQAVVTKLPFTDIVQWAEPWLLKTLIDHGASPDQAVVSFHGKLGHESPLTPLGAACLRGDVEVFNLLVAEGAQVDVDDSLRDRYPASYAHIPILLAARHMAETGETSMLDACIANGADINRPCHTHPDLTKSDDELADTEPERIHACMTPLLAYLNSIKSWNTQSPDASDKKLLTPIEGVKYLIHTLGAKAASPLMPPIRRKYRNLDQKLHDRTFAGTPSPVELLLVQRGIESLNIPEFFNVVKLLVDHGGTGPDFARLLVRIDGENASGGSTGDIVDVEALWQKFLALVQPQLDSLDQTAKDGLLRRVITDKGKLRHRVAHPSQWVKVRAIGRASITALIRAGADINDTIDASDTAKCPDKKTPLHQLVSNFVHTDCLAEDYLHNHPSDWHRDCPYTMDVVKSFGGYLDFLVRECGADPKIESLTECSFFPYKTPIATLLSPMASGMIEHEGGLVEQSLMRFVAILEGKEASQVPERYEGERKPFHSFWKMRRSILCLSDCSVGNADLEIENSPEWLRGG